jgi:hypothetical protein
MDKPNDDRAQFNYQLLSRLQQDCDYYLGCGNRVKKHLWAGDEVEQIRKMKELYDGFNEKPEWITLEDIARYETALSQINLPEVGCVLGMPYPDWPDSLTTFSDRKVYQLGVAHGKAVQNHQDGQSAEQLMSVLVQAIESSGFSVSGPTDVRAAEHNEPTWVCNARSAVAEFVAAKIDLSYREAEAIAGAKESWKLVGGSDSIKRYSGKVLGVTAHHVVQSLGKTAAIHHKEKLDRVPEKDEVLNIVYNGNGQGKIEPRAKAQDKGQSR